LAKDLDGNWIESLKQRGFLDTTFVAEDADKLGIEPAVKRRTDFQQGINEGHLPANDPASLRLPRFPKGRRVEAEALTQRRSASRRCMSLCHERLVEIEENPRDHPTQRFCAMSG
jgi:hypothetical protein